MMYDVQIAMDADDSRDIERIVREYRMREGTRLSAGDSRLLQELEKAIAVARDTGNSAVVLKGE
jgi:hypothetical protein